MINLSSGQFTDYSEFPILSKNIYNFQKRTKIFNNELSSLRPSLWRQRGTPTTQY